MPYRFCAEQLEASTFPHPEHTFLHTEWLFTRAPWTERSRLNLHRVKK